MNDIGTLENIQEGPFFYHDAPFRDKALGNSGAIESETFDMACTQGALKIMLFAVTGATVAATKTVKVELLGSDKEDGTYTVYKTVTITGAESTGTAITADEKQPLVQFIPEPDAPKYGKLKITTDSNLSAVKVTAKIGYIAR